MADRKDYIPQRELDKLIISQYREGRPAKSIARDLKHYTIDHEGGALPRGYVERVIYEDVMANGFA